jgi:hypothetical protein
MDDKGEKRWNRPPSAPSTATSLQPWELSIAHAVGQPLPFAGARALKTPPSPWQVRSSLLSYLSGERQNGGAGAGVGAALKDEQQFIRTKLSVVVMLLIKADYPEAWPSAFDELLMLAPR